MSGFETQRFRMSFTTLALWWLAVFLLMDGARALATGTPFDELRPLANIDLSFALAVALAVILVLYLRTEVSAEGLESFSAIGETVFVSWTGITAAKKVNLLGLGFYKLRGENSGTVYVARFLSHQREFDLLAKAITTGDNPLHKLIDVELE